MVCQADTEREALGARGELFVVTDHPHPHDDVEGLRAITGDGRVEERHALSDELELLLPVVHRGLPVDGQAGPPESLCDPPRLRVMRVRLRSEAHWHAEERVIGSTTGPEARMCIGFCKARTERTCVNFLSTSEALTGGTTFAYRLGHPPKTAFASRSRASEAVSHLDAFDSFTACCTALDVSQTFTGSTKTKTAARLGTMRFSRWSLDHSGDVSSP